MLKSLATAFLVLSSQVSAHGYVRDWTISNKKYITYEPYAEPDFTATPKGIGRYLGNGINPMKSPLSSAMTCNVDSYPSPQLANVTAGSTIMAQWNEWPHRGPLYTYMARCPNGRDCSDFLGTTGLHWFKIEEAGVITHNGYVDWATQKMYDAGNTWNITIPKCIKDGPYLIRHETMAVQDAYMKGGAQFYPQCAQVFVRGGGKASPKLVAIPGDIKPDDTSVFFDNKKGPQVGYVPPGSRPLVC